MKKSQMRYGRGYSPRRYLGKNRGKKEIAQKIGTINYEVVTRINPLIPRIIVDYETL